MFYFKEYINQKLLKAVVTLKNGKEVTLSEIIKLYANDKWITIHPPHGNKEDKGIPLKIGEDGTVQAGAGGKFTGKRIGQIKKRDTSETAIPKETDTVKPAKPKKHWKEELSDKLSEKNKELNSLKQKIEEQAKKISEARKKYLLDRSDNVAYAEYKDAVYAHSSLSREYSEKKVEEAEIIKNFAKERSKDVEESLKNYSSKTNKIVSSISSIPAEDPSVIETAKKRMKDAQTNLMDVIYGRKQVSDQEKELLKKEYNDASRDYFSVIKLDKVEAETKKAKYVSEAIKNDKKTSFSMTADKVTAGVKNLFSRAKEVLDGCLSEELKLGHLSIQGKRGRAYQSDGDGIFLQTTDGLGTMIHEYAHYLEANNPDMLANSLAFLEYRTKGEDIKSLRSLTGIKGYSYNEVAKKDKFFSPYCGKVYNKIAATEIMSMGMERLFTDPQKFAQEDREYFDFVIANMRGEL